MHETIGFKYQKEIRDGVREIRDAIVSGRFEDYDDKKYVNYKTLIEGS